MLTTQGIALGYGILAGIIYGKHKIMDRILLGVGALAFGAASYGGLKVGLDQKFSKPPLEYVTGTIFGVLNGLIALGAIAAAVNPKMIQSSAAGAVKEAIPF
jgi:hypothetical protein